MSQPTLKFIWSGAMLGLLAATSPSWIGTGAERPLGYDAPWIYPSLNPAVQSQLELLNSKKAAPSASRSR